MKQPLDLPTELLITTLNFNSEVAILASAWAGNYDSRKNGKRFKAELDKITQRQQAATKDILKRYAPELLVDEVDMDIYVQLLEESDPIEAFNLFVKLYLPKDYAHFIDTDDNAGQYVREKIRANGIKHFDKTHFTGVTIGDRKFVYCPVGNIISWSEGDYEHKWCHWCKNGFEELQRG
jgi:hypothetical protein